MIDHERAAIEAGTRAGWESWEARLRLSVGRPLPRIAWEDRTERERERASEDFTAGLAAYNAALQEPGGKREASHNGVPDSFWIEPPCGHPPDPVAAWANDGMAVCHCGTYLEPTEGVRIEGAPGLVQQCSECGCHVAVPPRPAPERIPADREVGLCQRCKGEDTLTRTVIGPAPTMRLCTDCRAEHIPAGGERDEKEWRCKCGELNRRMTLYCYWCRATKPAAPGHIPAERDL